MAPKKKTKITAEKNPEKSENELEEKYRNSVLDIAVLQDRIALQCEAVRKVQSDRADLRRCVRELEQKLQHERQDHRDIYWDLSRQYKTTQTELTNKVKMLEQELRQLKEDLVLSQEELSKEKREHKQVEQEKDAVIANLRHKLDNMESDYEKVLHVPPESGWLATDSTCKFSVLRSSKETLDSLSSQLSLARQGWEDKSTTLHQKYKELLSEFGLYALDI